MTAWICFSGELSKPQLGLHDGVWQHLASSVDTIVHNGALVNHAFTYEQLFEPNVLGSVEVSPGLYSLVLTRSLTPCWRSVLAAASPMSGKDLAWTKCSLW